MDNANMQTRCQKAQESDDQTLNSVCLQHKLNI